ncbi:MAG: glutamate--cysteine ligase [Polyangiaceae bacterium]|nr:glutamate--cysteine ligase [Polyangiaceae bacterium]
MTSGTRAPLHLFEAIGFEVEYMIVDAEHLGVRPMSDWLLEQVAGQLTSEVDLGNLSWSNELVLHVLEFKTTDPLAHLAGLSGWLTRDVARANTTLAARGARLLPTAMHPLMDPTSETRLWPHDGREVYEAFDRLFGCRGHGWSNLQSVHVNLPFCGDREFGPLHAAIRATLPLVPMLAASSPVVEGRLSGNLDSRLVYYRHNCDRLPVVTAEVVPEPVLTQAGYQEQILQPIGRALARSDPSGVLDPTWVNARGAIARFDRGSIEIRLLDTQECAAADVAIAAAVSGLVRGLVEERWASRSEQQALPTSLLGSVLGRAMVEASRARIDPPDLVRVLGLPEPGLDGSRIWAHLVDRLVREGLLAETPEWLDALGVITSRGCLASRIVRALGDAPSRARIVSVYRELAECLADNRMFVEP